MDELKNIFISMGLKNIATHAQSGNVMFESSIADENILIKRIENLLLKNLSGDVLVFIRTIAELNEIVKLDPYQKLKFKVPTKLYITFLKDELKQKRKLPYLSSKKDVEVLQIKDREIYCVTPEINGSYSFPNLFIEKKFGIKATTRNWNTIIKVIEMME